MKKIIQIAVVSLLLMSCTKDNCYVCTFGTVNGWKHEDVQVCGDKPNQFVDSLNNPLPFTCIKK